MSSLLSSGHGRIAQGFRVPEGHGAPMERCSQRWYNATLDHFSWASGPQHWQQRYFVCQEHWRKPSTSAADGDVGPIFFYAGNEANVELYVALDNRPTTTTKTPTTAQPAFGADCTRSAVP